MTNDNCNLFCFMCCRLTTSMLVVGRGSVFWAVHSKALILPRQCLLVKRKECGSEGVLWGGCQAGVWCSPPHFPPLSGKACGVGGVVHCGLHCGFHSHSFSTHSVKWKTKLCALEWVGGFLYVQCVLLHIQNTPTHTHPHPHTFTHIHLHVHVHHMFMGVCEIHSVRWSPTESLLRDVPSAGSHSQSEHWGSGFEWLWEAWCVIT